MTDSDSQTIQSSLISSILDSVSDSNNKMTRPGPTKLKLSFKELGISSKQELKNLLSRKELPIPSSLETNNQDTPTSTPDEMDKTIPRTSERKRRRQNHSETRPKRQRSDVSNEILRQHGSPAEYQRQSDSEYRESPREYKERPRDRRQSLAENRQTAKPRSKALQQFYRQRVNVTNITTMAEDPNLILDATAIKRAIDYTSHPCNRLMKLLEVAGLYSIATMRACKSDMKHGEGEYVDTTLRFLEDVMNYTTTDNPNYCKDDQIALFSEYILNLMMAVVNEQRYLSGFKKLTSLQEAYDESAGQLTREQLNEYVKLNSYHINAQKCLDIATRMASNDSRLSTFEGKIERAFLKFHLSSDPYCCFAYVMLGVRLIQGKRRNRE